MTTRQAAFHACTVTEGQMTRIREDVSATPCPPLFAEAIVRVGDDILSHHLRSFY